MPFNPARILYEDEHLLAVNKLAGELVVKGAGKVEKLPLLDFLKKEYPGLRPLNRLDFETSGIVLFAKTKKAFELMREEYQERELTKIYRTLVLGHLKRKDGVIDRPLPARAGKGMTDARTSYHVLEELPLCSLVEAEMTTGRFHQIRRHFSGIGHPIALDYEYGDKKRNQLLTRQLGYRRFFLHAYSLRFKHPITGEDVEITCLLPRNFEEVVKKLRNL